MEIIKESRVRDYFTLLKPRVMSLVIFTAIIGMYASSSYIHPFIAFTAILCIALGAGGAAAINMWYDRDIDSIMLRTKKRPIPSGYIVPNEALHYGVAISCLSVILLGLATNYLSAFLLAFAIFFYSVVYTMLLKRRTPQNIVIGGLAGSIQPLIGWTSVTNNISLEPIIYCLIIFMWTPPHFWALSIYSSKDYKEAGVPMLPLTNGEQSTKKHIFCYSIIMVIVTLMPNYFNYLGVIYFIIANILGAIFIYLSFKLLKEQGHKTAPKLFGYSILYLFAIYLAIIIDKLLNL